MMRKYRQSSLGEFEGFKETVKYFEKLSRRVKEQIEKDRKNSKDHYIMRYL